VERDAVCVRVPFEVLDLATADEFARWADEQVEATDGALVLDLGDVEFVMAAGVQALLDLDGRLETSGRTLAVTGSAPIVVRVLTICDLGERWRLR
jgi:anti-anti-sigma factor